MFPANPSGEPDCVCAIIKAAPQRWGEVASILERQNAATTKELWAHTLEEVEKGWLEGPFQAEGLDTSETVPCIRFPIVQGDKVRYCDDLRRSGTNSAARSTCKVDLPSALTLAEVTSEAIRKNKEATGDRRIRFWKGDHRDAYKQLPLKPHHAAFCTVVAKNPQGGGVALFYPKVLLFGPSLAVTAYNAVSRLVSFLYAKIFGLPCIAFFDDFAGVAPESLGDTPLDLFIELNKLIGL